MTAWNRFNIYPNISYNCGKIKDINIKIIPNIRKIEMRGLIMQVEIMPINEICLIVNAIIG